MKVDNANGRTRVVGEDRVKRFDDPAVRRNRVLGFTDIGAFAREPEYEHVCAEFPRDIGVEFRAVDGPPAGRRVIRGETTIDSTGVLPQAGRYEFRSETFAVEDLFHLPGPGRRFRGG